MDIKPTQYNKQPIESMDDVYSILHCMLVHTKNLYKKIHLFIIMNQVAYIYYIALITFGTYKSRSVEYINTFRIAVMKNAIRMFLVPSRLLTQSDTNKNITERIIRVDHILNINLVFHLTIIPKSYISFRKTKLMEELELILKYAPTYLVIECTHKQKKIAKEKLAVTIDKIKAEKARREKFELTMPNALLNKGA